MTRGDTSPSFLWHAFAWGRLYLTPSICLSSETYFSAHDRLVVVLHSYRAIRTWLRIAHVSQALLLCPRSLPRVLQCISACK